MSTFSPSSMDTPSMPSHLPPTPHQQHISMLSMLYPSIPLNAISAIYHSNENKDLGERMRQTRDVLEQIQTRNYFREGEEEKKNEGDSNLVEEEQSSSSSSKEHQELDDQIKTLSDEDRKHLEETSSWFSSVTNKFSFWNRVAENAENTSLSSVQTTASSWWNFLKEKLVRGPLPPISVVNHSNQNVAFTTYGPFDLHVPIKTVADIIRMIQNGTLKLCKVDAKGGEGTLKERLGPGVVVTFAATKKDTKDLFSGDGWFQVGIKFTMGFSENKYEYPKDFSVHRIPLHVVASIPAIGPYYYSLLKYLVTHE
uniref:Uncharacterized protein n=1 Tax=Percolomonas cosmopolitus TaxID=63605 RepID=A0A6U0L7H8_9EUKA|mmetsp:Transcript_7117/g.26651  ORF Transcript_7117/g.26651 Transcript_7117/m.26651 type:complete len:311 (+) Transcript_7117:28-960(+)